MRLSILIVILSFSFFGKAQTFCDSIFGDKFHFEFEEDSSNYLFNFDLDTLNFFQYKEIYNSKVIDLNCEDSTFRVQSIHKDSLYYQGEKVWITSFDPGNQGKWTFNFKNQTISFKLDSTSIWQKFRIETIGTQEDNPYINYTSTGDYRYLIRLIAIKK